MGDLAQLEVEPPKVFMINLENNERWDALFNPTTLEERLEVKFNRVQVQGLSHERLQYINTGNLTIPLEFFLSQVAISERFGGQTFTPLEDRAFLMSLAYPAADIDFSFQGTPRVLFVWPSVLRIVGRVMSVEFMHRSFRTTDGQTTMLVAAVEFEEDRDMRILMDEIRQYGGQRFRTRVQGDDVEEGGG